MLVSGSVYDLTWYDDLQLIELFRPQLKLQLRNYTLKFVLPNKLMWWIPSFRASLQFNKNKQTKHRESRESCPSRLGGGLSKGWSSLPVQALGFSEHFKACPLLLAIGVLQRSPYLAPFWVAGCVLRVGVCCKGDFVSWNKNNTAGWWLWRAGNKWVVSPFWGIFGCKESPPVDGRNQKEIRMEASWTIVWTCDLLYIN